MSEHESVIDEAKRIVSSDRASTHGEAERNFETIAALWNAYLGSEVVRPGDVGMLMVLLKIARQRSNPGYRDNYVDMIGYSYLTSIAETISRP